MKQFSYILSVARQRVTEGSHACVGGSFDFAQDKVNL